VYEITVSNRILKVGSPLKDLCGPPVEKHWFRLSLDEFIRILKFWITNSKFGTRIWLNSIYMCSFDQIRHFRGEIWPNSTFWGLFLVKKRINLVIFGSKCALFIQFGLSKVCFHHFWHFQVKSEQNLTKFDMFSSNSTIEFDWSKMLT